MEFSPGSVSPHHPTNEVLVVHTMDDFKTNCSLLESALATDLNDPIPDVTKVLTWIDWLEAGNGTPEHQAHFFGEAIPRVVRALLKRRYLMDNAKGPQARAVQHLFHRVLGAIVRLAPQGLTSLLALLEPLFDEGQTFYMSFGHEHQFARIRRTATAGNHGSAATGFGEGGVEELWKESVVPGSHLQIKRQVVQASQDAGQSRGNMAVEEETGWAVVVVLEVSPTGTEVKVEMEGGEIKWYSLDDPDVAALGAEPASGHPPCEAATSASSGEELSDLTGQQQMEVDQMIDTELPDEDVEWRSKLLEVGSLCDARREASPGPGPGPPAPPMWYQAMVLGVKRKEMAPPGHQEVDEVLVGMVGWNAQVDQWFRVDSSGLAPVNSKSKGQRGTGVLRAEMLAVASEATLHVLLKDSSDGQCPAPDAAPMEDDGVVLDSGLVVCGAFAASRENTWTSAFLVDNLNHFGGLYSECGQHGFARVLHSLCFQEGQPIRFDRLASFMVAMGRVANVLTITFLTSFVLQLQEVTVQALQSLREEDLRLVTKDMVDGTLGALEALLRRVKPRVEVSAFIEGLLLETILKFFHSSIFNRRLDALKLLLQFVRMAQDSIRFPAGIRAILVDHDTAIRGGAEPASSSSVARPLMAVEYQLVSIARALTPDQLAEWVESKAILEYLYDRRCWHDELIERGTEIAIFLAQHGRLTDQTLEVMWAATHCDISYMEKPACAVLMSLCNSLGLDHLKFLLNQLSRLQPQENYKIESIDLLRIICRRAMRLVAADSISGRATETEAVVNQALEALWQAAQDGNGLTDSLACHAIKGLKEIIDTTPPGLPSDWSMHFRRFEKVLMACVENLRRNRSVEPALDISRAILYSFPKDLDTHVSSSGSSSAMAIEGDEMVEPMGPPECTGATVLAWLQVYTNFLDLLLECIVLHQKQSSEVVPSRMGHLEGLQCRLDALAALLSVAAGSSISLSQEQLHVLWKHLYLEAHATAQREIFLQWLVRALVSDQGRQQQRAEGEGGPPSTLLGEGVIRWLFALMADARNIRSDHFSEAALSCLVHLFLKINTIDGKVSMDVANRNLMASMVPSSLLLVLRVQVLSLDLTGLDALWSVHLHALQPVVVNRSVDFVTRLTQRLSPELTRQGMLHTWRKQLLDRCMCDIKGVLAAEEGPNNTQLLLRSLAFLDTLLNEAAPEGYGKVRSHSSIRTGAVLRLNLNNNVRNSNRPTVMQITVYKNDTGAELVGAVAAHVGRPPHELRVFRGGRELTEAHRKSTLGQLGVQNNEALLVCLRMMPKPAVTSGEDCGNSNLTSPEDVSGELPFGDVESLPMVVLSSRPDYFDLFFKILDRFLPTSEEVSHRVWRLLQRLPTSSAIYQKLLMVGMGPSQTKEGAGTPAAGASDGAEACLPLSLGVPKLLYALQLVQYLVEPAEDPADLANLYQLNPPLEAWLVRFVQRGGVAQLYILLTQHRDIKALVVKAPGILLNKGQDGPATSSPSSDDKDQKVRKECTIPSLLCDAAIHLVKVLISILDRCFDGPAAAASPDMSVDEVSHGDPGDNGGACMMDVMEVGVPPYLKAGGGKGVLYRLSGQVRAAALANLDLAHLQTCAMNQAWAMARRANAGMILTVADGELAMESLKLWHACCRLSPCLLTHIPSFMGLDYLLVDLLMCRGPANVAPFIRREAGATLLALCELSKPLLAASADPGDAPAAMASGFLTDKLMELRPNRALERRKLLFPLHEVAPVSQELYSLLNQLVADGLTPGGWCQTFTQEQIKAWSRDLADQILGSPMVEVEGDDEEEADYPLKGALEVLATIVKNVEEPLTSLNLPGSLASFLLKDCLFGSTEVDLERPCHPQPPRCASRVTRQAAYGLLIALCGMSESTQADIMALLVPYHQRVKLHPTQARTMIEKVQVQEKEKEGVGADDHHKDSSASDQDCGDLWGFDPSRDRRAPVGYAGIRNLGCICYMNALLQQLYMIPALRQGILSARWSKADGVDDLSVDDRKDCLLSQLQRMFGFLTLTTRKAYYPVRWCHAFKDESGNPVNVRLQQDAVEFLQSLCDRLESWLSKTLHGKDLVQNCVGGLVTNQLIRCPRTGRPENDIRESDEPFYCIQLKVQDQGSLEASLKEFVQGETISDFRWNDKDEEGIKIIKRVCIKRTSDALIFHLKRFEFDFDTLRQGKLNDEFRFPMIVDIYPYTKEGLAEQEEGNLRTTTVPRESYLYELVGVVVHTGTADSGHYYSFIKEPPLPQHASSSADAPTRKRRREEGSCGGNSEAGTWLEFNDSTVKPYDISQLGADCFGGSTSTHEYDLASKRHVEKVVPIQKNAYMLVYARCGGTGTGNSNRGDPCMNGIGANGDGGSSSHHPLWWPLASEEMLVSQEVWREVLRDNAEHLHHQKVFSKEHLEFVVSLVGQLQGGDKQGLSMAIDFVLHLLSRAADAARLMPKVVFSLRSLILMPTSPSSPASERVAAEVLHHLVFEELAIVLDLLLHCPVTAVRKGMADLLLALCQAVKPTETQSGGPEALASVHLEACTKEAHRLLHYPSPPLSGPVNGSEPASAASSAPNLQSDLSTGHVLVEIFLHDVVLADLVTNWNRANELLWFLLSWAELSDEHCAYLIGTKAVCKLADIFMGTGSPLHGVRYPVGSRKTTPLSKSIAGRLPLTSKGDGKEDDVEVATTSYGPPSPPRENFTGPEWTCLLQLIALLTRKAGFSQSVMEEDEEDFKPANVGTDTAVALGDKCPTTAMGNLDVWSRRCLVHRNFYYLALLNAPMYWKPVTDLACRLGWDWLEYSNDVMGYLADSLLLPDLLITDVQYIFRVMASLLELDDGLKRHRARELLCLQQPMARSLWKAVHAKRTTGPLMASVVLLCILALARHFPLVMRELHDTRHIWGPPSLEFLRSYTQNYTVITAAAQVKNGAVPPSTGAVVVWGDTAEDGQVPWLVRLERALAEVEAMLKGGKEGFDGGSRAGDRDCQSDSNDTAMLPHV